MWTNAVTVDVCSECGDDIWPGDVILITLYRCAPGILWNQHAFMQQCKFCKGCGELYQESMELGNDEETREQIPGS